MILTTEKVTFDTEKVFLATEKVILDIRYLKTDLNPLEKSRSLFQFIISLGTSLVAYSGVTVSSVSLVFC